ncbi:hypothetical protein O9992_30870 [Vibrio lentus]|nr:hypothetical protein [Vibrio lentus]
MAGKMDELCRCLRFSKPLVWFYEFSILVGQVQVPWACRMMVCLRLRVMAFGENFYVVGGIADANGQSDDIFTWL